MPAYNEPPDLDEIPEDKSRFMQGLYSEIRRTRQMAENVFWVVLISAIFAALIAGWLFYQYEIAH